MQSTDQTHHVVTEYLHLLTSRNKKIVELFSEGPDWYIQGDPRIPWIGKRTNKAQISEFFRLLWEATLPVAASVDQLLVTDGSAAISGQFTTIILPSHEQFSSEFSISMTINDGLITKYRLLEDSFLISSILFPTA